MIPDGRVRVDWEAELVVCVGRGGRSISEADAWSHVAGVTAGQDVSDREEQFRALRQFTMAKSFDTYAPTGPVLVTPDELTNRDDLKIETRLDGEVMQSSRTDDLIFPVAELIAWISRICTLEAGDLIFTGTPSGVGDSREPPRYLGARQRRRDRDRGHRRHAEPRRRGPELRLTPSPAATTPSRAVR